MSWRTALALSRLYGGIYAVWWVVRLSLWRRWGKM